MTIRNTFTLSRRNLLQKSAAAGGALLLSPLAALAQDFRYAKASKAVRTASGRMTGLAFPGGANAFYGVPYGKTTAGVGRFQLAQAPDSWNGVAEMTRVGDRCPQAYDAEGLISEIFALDRREAMSEDCLRINVFTPALDKRDRPVMVWFHGGGYSSGSGSWILYDGKNLAQTQDVVVVTVNHRLNVFGHLDLSELLGDEFADSGNAGIMDCVSVLEWVRDNIAGFGGNPDNVTIFGQSGGAGKVSTLLAMPAAKGLFHKAIAMSGANLQGISQEAATENAERYLAALKVDKANYNRIVNYPWAQMLNTYLATPGINLGPVVDGNHLPRAPFQPDATPVSRDVPLMMGSTEHETYFFPGQPIENFEDSELLSRIKQVTGTNDSQASTLIDVYRRGRPGINNVKLYHIINSDNTFRRGILTQAERKADQGGAPVYKYYFSWQSRVREGRLGAYHCIDIPFAFNNVDECASMLGGGEDRYLLASRMSTAFTQFARTGNPNNDLLPRWDPFDRNRRAMMRIDNNPELLINTWAEERAALASIS